MLHTTFREKQTPGSGEEDFERFLPYIGRGGNLCHVTQMPRTKYPRRFYTKYGFGWSSGLGEDVRNC